MKEDDIEKQDEWRHWEGHENGRELSNISSTVAVCYASLLSFLKSLEEKRTVGQE